MPNFRQLVINRFENCTRKIETYSLALIATTHRKTCAGISRSLDTEYRSTYDYLSTLNDNHDKDIESFISGKVL